jgi:hypothetical protein
MNGMRYTFSAGLPHLPYISDLTPRHYHLYGFLKAALRAIHSCTDEECQFVAQTARAFNKKTFLLWHPGNDKLEKIIKNEVTMLGNRDSSIEKQYRQTNHFNFTSPQRSHN